MLTPALIKLPGVQVEVACDALPGPQVATCRTCDENTGILPHTCFLLYSFSETEDFVAKVVTTNQDKLSALFLMLLLSILVFMLLKELRRNQRVPWSIWRGRGGDGGNLKTKMRLEKGQQDNEKRLPEVGGCCQEKAREMTVDSGNSDGRTAPTFLLEHSMIKERKGRKKVGKRSVDRS